MKRSVPYGLVLLVATPMLAPGQDATLRKQMEQATVRVVCPIPPNREKTGSGVILGDSRHVVTNFHVAGDGICVIALGPQETFATRVVAADRRRDLAILEADRPLPRQPILQAAPRSTVTKGDRVIVMGFPAAAEIRGIDQASTRFEVKLTGGYVSGFVKSEDGTDWYQLDAAINPGHSGGPAFDSCGQLIGINVAHSTAGAGVNYAIMFDELRPLLDGAGLTRQVEKRAAACVVAAPADWVTRALLILAIVVGSAAVIVLAATRHGRQAVTGSIRRVAETHSQPPPAPEVALASVPDRLHLRGVAGQYTGADIPLEERPLTIGRDPRQCDLVFPPDVDSISKKHCVLRYRGTLGRIEIEDCGSTNGTYINSGEVLRPGQPRELLPGDRFYLGDSRNMFEVRAARQSAGFGR